MDLEAQRAAAGEQAAQLVQDGMVIGYGTGRAATAALEALARRKVRVRGVPTSQKTVQTCQRLGLALVDLDDHPRLDLVIDGADEVDPRAQLIKGGGGAHVREKLVALASARIVIVVEEMKLVERLGSTRGVPIEVVAFGWTGTLQRIAKLLPGAARREGPLSDSGGVLVDAPLPAGADLREVARALKAITGVVDHGLFLDFAPTVIVGGPSGARVFSGG
ncbi:MAG: ribose 5-phosphate isomerase A [Deltaproteobacteria bacterium 13_1_20CM_2_69_21]|nr:MAG: ribose 5-phosphate isomerase A [Deltaproteobacteria bacterium 13_1_40CM_68_24]OLC73403.1 MAG: ribose 5-phosphate isomerase A [Deltaproteobacteria bacterium 13_1_40CM_4_68_19]OLD09754.1 MAG: ribose 5-phosphate isomerase A [Deltaproteobacteria bacterium 13_1_40CM_3_69_14]OLD45730.1 MAG: ribose 5-phosphate isomerase A [Chloroflexi bacterium 13_1_40CM_2_68_14]OLE62001.1 MAG: ribose 5-phosphate isomerase A [Deltaproteobacteria bacterium 13_1_20CM_2_69_21]